MADLPTQIERAVEEILTHPATEWQRRINALCASHPDCSAAIRSMYTAALSDPRWTTLDRLMDDGLDDRPRDPDSAPPCDAGDHPKTIGPYQILEVLGSGGMGTVYKCEQRDAVRRLVAVKVIKLGLDTKDIVARFELERRALAAMSHSSIAKVFAAGTTERGQPYFVMELAEGLPLTRYCDRHRLTLEERIELFQQVCAGVQHAHQKGVIHRDLKPGNILVVREGDKAVPKILDFGVAKATNHDLMGQTIYTEREQILGTPEYMAPEQAAADHDAVDARADIYSLGVVLFELLVGDLPFRSEDLRKGGWLEIQRRLREDDPPKPSVKLRSAGDGASRWAGQRRMSLKALSRELHGDLDWVVLKAMAKEPERRYASAAGLAADLRRYLDHDPVTAGPPSTSYRLHKLMQRYRLQLLAASAVAITAIVGAGVAVNYAWEAKQRLARFDQLSSIIHIDRARKREKTLYPAWPNQIEAMRRWLAEDSKRVRDAVPQVRAALVDLRAPTPPLGAEEREASRKVHARYAELVQLRTKLEALRRAQTVREKHGEPLPYALDPSLDSKTAKDLNTLAWPLVNPDRTAFGREVEGLALAQRAVAKNTSPPDQASLLNTLAWAWFCNGKDDEARARMQEAVEAANASERAPEKADVRRLTAAIDTVQGEQGRAQMARLVEEVEDLEGALVAWQWGKDADRFLHDELARALPELQSFAASEPKAVERRLAWAERIGALTITRFATRWAEARAAIAKADGDVASELYRARPIYLKPQMGLVPIGMNPKTKLWEFYELRSAWDPEAGVDPAAIEIPVHRDDGSIDVKEGTGIVFVLLPGGPFKMGAPDDPLAKPDETQHDVTLDAFFLAQHELTRAQWCHLSGGPDPSFDTVGTRRNGDAGLAGWTHPVDNVDWAMSQDLLGQHGLVLPTEAQWEYGCRAGTATAWWTGKDASSLGPTKMLPRGAANVLDRKGAAQFKDLGVPEDFDDGWIGAAPVGSYAANTWGLFDVHGNVWEWTRDASGSDPPRAGDGLRLKGDSSSNRVYRGGAFYATARLARASVRGKGAPVFRGHGLGLRAARLITE